MVDTSTETLTERVQRRIKELDERIAKVKTRENEVHVLLSTENKINSKTIHDVDTNKLRTIIKGNSNANQLRVKETEEDGKIIYQFS